MSKEYKFADNDKIYFVSFAVTMPLLYTVDLLQFRAGQTFLNLQFQIYLFARLNRQIDRINNS